MVSSGIVWGLGEHTQRGFALIDVGWSGQLSAGPEALILLSGILIHDDRRRLSGMNIEPFFLTPDIQNSSPVAASVKLPRMPLPPIAKSDRPL